MRKIRHFNNFYVSVEHNNFLLNNILFKIYRPMKMHIYLTLWKDLIMHRPHVITVYIHDGTFLLIYALRDTLGISNGSFVMKRMSTSGKAT